MKIVESAGMPLASFFTDDVNSYLAPSTIKEITSCTEVLLEKNNLLNKYGFQPTEDGAYSFQIKQIKEKYPELFSEFWSKIPLESECVADDKMIIWQCDSVNGSNCMYKRNLIKMAGTLGNFMSNQRVFQTPQFERAALVLGQ